MVTARWVSNGSYIIGDANYGYNLCRVNFTGNVLNELAGNEVNNLTSEIAKLVSDKVKKARQKNEGIVTV